MQTKFLPHIIIGVLVVAGIAGASWYFVMRQPALPPEETTPSVVQPPSVEMPEDETANWKVYRSEKCKFELKYPNKFATLPFQKIVSTEEFKIDKGCLGYPQNYSFYYQEGDDSIHFWIDVNPDYHKLGTAYTTDISDKISNTALITEIQRKTRYIRGF